MPPTSLSTDPVTMPSPTAARKAKRTASQRVRRDMSASQPAAAGAKEVVQDIVHCDGAHQVLIGVQHWHRKRSVLGQNLHNVADGRVVVHRHQTFHPET